MAVVVARPPVDGGHALHEAVELCGFPAIVLPSGVTGAGLPTSVQLVAPPFAEARLLAVAHALEQELGVAPRLGIEPRG